MRRAIKLATSMGAASLIVAASATAGTPVPVKAWSTIGTGTVVFSTPCPTDFSCTTVASGGGFAQRKLFYLGNTVAGSGTQAALNTGDTFFQTIVTDAAAGNPNAANWTTGATGALKFYDENFVKAGNTTAGGIAGVSHIEEANATQGNFALDTVMNRNGWANTAGNKDSVVITAEINAGPAFNHTDRIRLGATNNVDVALDFRQASFDDIFLFRKAGGQYSDPGSFTVTLPGAPGYTTDSMTVNANSTSSMVYIASDAAGNFKHTGYAANGAVLGTVGVDTMARTSLDVASVELDLWPAYTGTIAVPPNTNIYAWGNESMTSPFMLSGPGATFAWDPTFGVNWRTPNANGSLTTAPFPLYGAPLSP